MTRDKFKEKLVQPNSGSDAFNKGVKQANSRANRLYKQALDDFESRMCLNCKHDANLCTYQESIKVYCKVTRGSDYIVDFEDFGCNRFERKTDERT